MSGIAREIELKFVCDPADVDRLMAAAPPGREDVQSLVAVYFDTPQGDLHKAGISFRLREGGGKRVLTLKRGSGFSREEHEAALAGEVSPLAIAPFRRLLPAQARKALRPAFKVCVTRKRRLVVLGGAEIEVAADQGEVRDAALGRPVCEIELELKSGNPAALFQLARRLSQAAPMWLSFEGKSDQGQALLAGGPPAARRKGKAALEPDASVAETFQALARDALQQIAANGAVLRQIEDSDATHQIRVGARRLRSALTTFAAAVSDERREPLRAELRWLARACDEARNLDVLALERVQPALDAGGGPQGLEALSLALEAARSGAYARVADVVGSERFRALLLETAAWVETGEWREGPVAAGRARAFGAEVLEARLRKLSKRGRNLAALEDDQRHEVRLQAKKLRYALEAFQPLYDADETARFVDRLKVLQDRLGALNDLATIEDVVEGLDLDRSAAYAAGWLAGRQSAGKDKLVAQAARALEKLARAPRFWRD